MPSSSKSQYRFWRMCANNPEFAKSRGISQETADEWHNADKQKKKDDPEWYANLPDKVEKEPKEHDVEEESFEGLGDVLKRILGFPTPEQKAAADKMVAGLAQDSSKLNEGMLKTGRIPLGNAGNLLHFKHWPNFHWTSDVDTIVKEFGGWALDFAKQRLRMMQKIQPVHDQKVEVEAIEAEFDTIAFHLTRKIMNFRHEPDHKAGKYLVEQKPTWGAFDPTIVAPNIQDARKICDLMLKISNLIGQLTSLRAKEPKFQNSDRFDKYDLGAMKIFTDMEKGLAEVLLHSLKKNVVTAGVSVESKLPKSFRW